MSYGQRLLSEYLRMMLPGVNLKENYRPEWLFGMELDFYSEEYQFALEFNGGQHVCATGLNANPWPQKKRDQEKKRICKARGIHFKKVEAIDLEYTRLRSILNAFNTRRLVRECNYWPLNKKSREYRELLKTKYGCPTAHRRGYAPRKEKILKANQKFPNATVNIHS